MHVAAWYDIFQGGALRNYEGLRAHAGTDAARRGQHLLVMIGGHAGSGRKIGDVDFGPAAAEAGDVTVAWYDYLFKGVHNHFADQPVRIFVLGANQWRDEDAWPPARFHSTKYFLHASNRANSIRGDGSLSTEAPKAEHEDRYTYDPANPVPTIGGPLCCDAAHRSLGREIKDLPSRGMMCLSIQPVRLRKISK